MSHFQNTHKTFKFYPVLTIFTSPTGRVGQVGQWYTSIPEKNSPKYPKIPKIHPNIPKIIPRYTLDLKFKESDIPNTRFKKPLYTVYPKTLPTTVLETRPAFYVVFRARCCLKTKQTKQTGRRITTARSTFSLSVFQSQFVRKKEDEKM